MKKTIPRQTTRIISALAFSFVLINFIAFFLYHDSVWAFRDGGPTKGIYAPGHFMLRTDEGIGFAFVDDNGYLNKDSSIGEDYILVFGKSHTNATEVLPNERYVDILDQRMTEQFGKRVYCVARGGSTFADLLSGFTALIEEFPNSSVVIIEMTELDNADDYSKALNQRIWTDQMSADYLFDHQSIQQRLTGFIKEFCPMITYVINMKLPNVNITDEKAFVHADSTKITVPYNNDREFPDLEANLNSIFGYIRTEYDGKIIVLYHPYVNIEKSGQLSLSEMENYDVLERCCNRNGILLCNTGEVFLDEYRSDYTVPYGFWNTSMGEGHLNKDGHRIIADLLFYDYLGGER